MLPDNSRVLDQYGRIFDVDSYYRDILLLLRGSCGKVKVNGKYKTVRSLFSLLFVDALLPHTSGVYYLLGLNNSSFSFIRMI